MFMRKFLLAFLCFGLLSVVAFGQNSRTTRPRVASTPPPPVMQGETPQRSTENRPPVLLGDSNKKQPAPASAPAVVDDGDEVIKVETNLITMPVSVLDREGRFVSGLQQKDFRVFENGIEQQLGYFQSVEQPFTVILMIDVSPSTAFQIHEIQDAAIAFVDQLRANDKVMVIAFDERVQILCTVTNNRRVVRNAILQAQFGDGTGLYEAIDRVINRELRQIEGRKAVVLFTDGVDTTSRRASYQSTIADVEEIDALFYPIRYNTQRDGFGGYGGGSPFPRRRGGTVADILADILAGGTITMGGGRGSGGRGGGQSSSEYETGRKYLEALALNSGGRNFEAESVYNLEASFAGIAEELRRQYSLGYYPEKVGLAGERKQIKVRVMRPNLVVRAKNSYIVGQNSSKLAGK